MTIMFEVGAEDIKRSCSVLHVVKKNESLKKYFGQTAKILGMGPYGPKIDDINGQCERS